MNTLLFISSAVFLKSPDVDLRVKAVTARFQMFLFIGNLNLYKGLNRVEAFTVNSRWAPGDTTTGKLCEYKGGITYL